MLLFWYFFEYSPLYLYMYIILQIIYKLFILLFCNFTNIFALNTSFQRNSNGVWINFIRGILFFWKIGVFSKIRVFVHFQNPILRRKNWLIQWGMKYGPLIGWQFWISHVHERWVNFQPIRGPYFIPHCMTQFFLKIGFRKWTKTLILLKTPIFQKNKMPLMKLIHTPVRISLETLITISKNIFGKIVRLG